MPGIGFIGTAFSGYFLASLSKLERWWIGLSSLFFIAPGIQTMLIGGVLVLPILIRQIAARRVATT
jgi:hypothetical protein